MIRNSSLHLIESVEESLSLLSKSWNITPEIYDLHLGKRNDLGEELIDINGVIFHLPFLSNESQYVLWNCLWPDCHNCCERQTRIPLTKDDIRILANKLGQNLPDFIKKETLISTWTDGELFGPVNTVRTQLCLKRRVDETEKDSGSMISCRFLDNENGCSIHSHKPGVCWMYPFASYLDTNSTRKITIHAKFQFTGDCPGFYLDKSMDRIIPILEEYSKKIFAYHMEYNRSKREGYCGRSSITLNRT